MAGEAQAVLKRFYGRFSGGRNARVWRAPGRVNLIGEHTDYNFGFVLPAAIDLACYTAAAPNGGDRLRVHSEDLDGGAEWPVGELAVLRPRGRWTDYIAGVAQQLIHLGVPIAGRDLLIRSTVPAGSGLSSSAALEVSVALALAGDYALDQLELTRLCHRAETEFVGLPCGIMDQFISVFGRSGAAICLDCRNLNHEVVALPAGMVAIAVDSGIKHELASSAYRQRVAECAAAVNSLRERWPQVSSLRDAVPSMLDQQIPEPALRRARHVVTENLRVAEFVRAAGRRDLEAMGQILFASHESLRLDYEVSCEELDFLVDTARHIPGVFGARMTGGGFGGSTVNLLPAELEEGFSREIRRNYQHRFGIDPHIYICRPSAGAGEMKA